MTSVMKATPRLILGGIQDLSARTPIAVPEQLPTHLPLIYLLTERGPTEPQVCIGTGFNQLYGSWSLDVRSKYCNHATMLARTIMSNANMCMIQRLIPAGARKSMLRMWLEVCPAMLPLYDRDAFGNILLDAQGNKVVKLVGGVAQEVQGLRFIWHVGLDPMGPAPVATAITNVPLTGTTPLTIGTTTVANGNRVVLNGQTDAANNGLYTVAISGGNYTLTPTVKPFRQAVTLTGFRAGDAVDANGNRLDGLVNQPAPTQTATADVPLTGTTPLTITTAGGPVTATNGLRVHLGAQTAGTENGDYLVQITGGNYTLISYIQHPTALGTSTLYPIRDFVVSSEGGYGDRVGLSLSAPNSQSTQAGDVATMLAVKAQEYRHKCVERPQNQQTPLTIETLAGEQYVDLTLKDGTVHPIYGNQLSANRAFVSAWQNTQDKSINPVFGPFGDQYIYRTQLDTVLALACDGSVTLSTTGEGYFDTVAGRDATNGFQDLPQNRNLLNIFTGVDQQGIPYYSFDVDSSVSFGGTAFGDNTVHYATGGNDGLINDVYGQPDTLKNLKVFDDLVQYQLLNFGKTEVKMENDAKYPFSTFWDSGYSINTKLAALTLIGIRKDVWVALATQSVAEYTDPQNPSMTSFVYQEINTGSEETSIGRRLSDQALLTPESEIYGTKCCRAIVVRQADTLLNSEYTGILPFTMDIAYKVSLYCGRGDGIWDSKYSFTTEPNNQVQLFGQANLTWRTNDEFDADWTAGLIWAQDYNRRALFYPAFQTVYPDDTSVLNSLPTMMACVELEKVAQRTWRDLTGDDKLTEQQYIAKSDRLITERTRGRFDGRFVIQPETYLTPADTQRGFSSSAKIHIYANNAKTVGQTTIVAHRMSDLTTAAA